MRLILLGSPGAGKGTQAKMIINQYNIPQISTGDIFRAAIAHNTALGKQVKKLVENGQLVPDQLVIELIKERLSQADCHNGFLLDGFPRTLEQAKALQELTSELKTPIDCVINIDVPDAEIIKRLSGRRVHPASGRTYHLLYQPPKQAGFDDLTGEPLIQRPDDQEETIKKRLAVYHEQTEPLIAFYQNYEQSSVADRAPCYKRIDGTQDMNRVEHEINRTLKNLSRAHQ